MNKTSAAKVMTAKVSCRQTILRHDNCGKVLCGKLDDGKDFRGKVSTTKSSAAKFYFAAKSSTVKPSAAKRLWQRLLTAKTTAAEMSDDRDFCGKGVCGNVF